MNIRNNLKYEQSYDKYYYNTLTLPEKPKPKRPGAGMPKPKKKKKKASLFATIALLGIIGAISAVVAPVGCKMFRQSYLDNSIKTVSSEYSFMNYGAKLGGINLSEFILPTHKYLSNYTFFNQSIEYPAAKKATRMKDLFLTERMTKLELALKNLNKAYPNIKPSIFVWSMEDGSFADINASAIYPSASIIKIPVLIQLYKSIEDEQFGLKDTMCLTEYYRSEGSGRMQFSQAGNKYNLYELASLMIQDSDNTATNMLISKVGSMNDVNAAMRSWGIEHTHLQTWLPDLTGNNYTTSRDLAKMLYNIGKDDNRFLNINSQSDIINIMGKVKNTLLIKAGLPEQASFFHKTGDIGTMLGDAGIVYMPSGQRYIVVILALRPYNNINGRLFIQEASKIIYNYMSTKKY